MDVVHLVEIDFMALACSHAELVVFFSEAPFIPDGSACLEYHRAVCELCPFVWLKLPSPALQCQERQPADVMHAYHSPRNNYKLIPLPVFFVFFVFFVICSGFDVLPM